jgi:hypothetical protein
MSPLIRTDSYFQPEAVAYKTVNGAASNFPTQHGKAIPVPTTDNTVCSGPNNELESCSFPVDCDRQTMSWSLFRTISRVLML